MRFFLVSTLVLLAAAVQAAGASTAALHPVDGRAAIGAAYGYSAGQESCRERLSAEPDYRSDKPLYLELQLGSGKDRFVTVVLDESGGKGSGYDTVYIDANNNNDLTDDEPVKPKVKKQRQSTSMNLEPLPVTVKYEDGAQRTLRIKLNLQAYDFPDMERTSWSANYQLCQHMEGKLSIGRKRDVLIGIYDGSSRGRRGASGCFDDFGVDRLRIDLNGDGKLDQAKEDFPLSKVIAFDGKLWELATDSAARQIEIKPCGLPVGTIKLSANFGEGATIEAGKIELAGNSGYAFACDISGEGTSRMPAGKYRISSGSLTLSDSEGAKWKVTFSYPKAIPVEAEGTTPIVMGRPAKVDPTITGTLRAGGTIQVSHSLVGVGGETYETISRNGKRLTPQVKISDAEGIDVAEGNMEYG